MIEKTFAAQHTAIAALGQISASLGHLPPADIAISPYTPGQLDVSVHDDLAGFEQWRAALGILANVVEYTERTHHMTLKAEGQFAGAVVELVGFAPLLPAAGGERA